MTELFRPKPDGGFTMHRPDGSLWCVFTPNDNGGLFSFGRVDYAENGDVISEGALASQFELKDDGLEVHGVGVPIKFFAGGIEQMRITDEGVFVTTLIEGPLPS